MDQTAQAAPTKPMKLKSNLAVVLYKPLAELPLPRPAPSKSLTFLPLDSKLLILLNSELEPEEYPFGDLIQIKMKLLSPSRLIPDLYLA
jgi:hypothetical protein